MNKASENSASVYFQRVTRLLGSTRVTLRDQSQLGLDAGASHAVDMVLQAADHGGKVFVIGNGGSAAIAAHLQSDLVRSVGRAMAFYDPPTFTASANDFGYGSVFETPLRNWVDSGDCLVAISSSGNSENVVRAASAAKEMGGSVITLTGFDPQNDLRALGDINFHVVSHHYGLVESAHAVLAHYLADQTQHLVNLRRPFNEKQ